MMKKLDLLFVLLFSLLGISCKKDCDKRNNDTMQPTKLVPIEIKGKIGFVNQNLNVICIPRFSEILKYNKNCFFMRKKSEFSVEDYGIFNDGTVFPLKEFTSISLIGEKHYALSNMFATKTTLVSELYNMSDSNEFYNFDGFKLEDSDSVENILVINPFNEDLPRYFLTNIRNEKKMTNNNFKKIIQVSTKNECIVVELDNFYYSIVDMAGNRLTDKEFFKLARYSDGLFLGETSNTNDVEIGFFDKYGNLKIPIELDDTQDIYCCPYFSNEVIPCIFENETLRMQESIIFKKSSHWALMDVSGSIIKENIAADYISQFSEDGVAVLCTQGENVINYYLIDRTGTLLNEEPFDYIYDSIHGYSRAIKSGVDYLIDVKNKRIYKSYEIMLQVKKE